MPPNEQALLVNLVGHAAGMLIFGIFLAMFLRDRAGSRPRGSRLTVIAASLALTWNAGSLVVLLDPQPGEVESIIATISFTALSLLPAVLLHIFLRESLPALRISAYALSAAAAALHGSEQFLQSPDLHRVGLLVITIGFGVLTVTSTAFAVFRGGAAPGSRLLGSMSLALFAVSFAHFGSHSGNAWSNELLFHHAGLPLAVFVLLQDYRFLLVDAFLRFVASAALAGLVATFAMRFPLPASANGALLHSLSLGVYGAALLLFAALNTLVQEWLTRAVFRRPDLAGVSARLRAEGPGEGHEYLEWCCAQLQTVLHAERVEAVDSLDECGDTSPHPAADHQHGQPAWVEAMVPLHGPSGAKRLLLFGPRRGGLRYLSEDYVFLGELAGVISERLNEFRTREMQQLVSEAELKALQSQINPHFLFNTLNTIYGSIPRESAAARKMVRNLSDIFRYSLQAGADTVAVDREIEIVREYLEIEQLRFPDRLQTDIDVAPGAGQCRIPVLTIQPLVENAIRHAIAVNPAGGRVRIAVALDSHDSHEQLTIQVTDSGGGSGGSQAEPGTALGLANVRRRLELCFGREAAIETSFHPDGSTVSLRIPVPVAAAGY